MTQTCIIKVGREHVRIARGAVTLLTNIDGIGVLPVVWCCSGRLDELLPDSLFMFATQRPYKGTIKKLQITAIEHNRAVIARFRARVAEENGDGTSDIRGKLPVVRLYDAMLTRRLPPGDPYSSYLGSSTQELERLQDS
jgi:hypothetical protein